MGLIYGIRHGGTRLDWGDGIDFRGHAIGVWHWLGHVMGMRLDQRDGIDLWGDGIDLWRYVMGAYDWIGEMGFICGSMPLGCDTGCTTSWGHGTESGRWDWFVGERHGGATLVGCEWWDWFMGVFHGDAQLDRDDGIDLWRRTMGCITLAWSAWGNWFMRARHEGDTGWIGAMGMIHRGVSNDKVLHGWWM